MSIFANERIPELELRIEKLRALLRESKRYHRYCEDGWYSCPKEADGCLDEREDECNCGADEWNTKVDNELGIE